MIVSAVESAVNKRMNMFNTNIIVVQWDDNHSSRDHQEEDDAHEDGDGDVGGYQNDDTLRFHSTPSDMVTCAHEPSKRSAGRAPALPKSDFFSLCRPRLQRLLSEKFQIPEAKP